MNVRTEFVLRVFEAKVAFNDLCKEFGISRKTGYKWKERFLQDGLKGLTDQSRRPELVRSSLVKTVFATS